MKNKGIFEVKAEIFGAVDSFPNFSKIGGWCFTRATSAGGCHLPIEVELHIDGVFYQKTTANETRPDQEIKCGFTFNIHSGANITH
jgi:hypothetical protein